jgi:hypothetical protein
MNEKQDPRDMKNTIAQKYILKNFRKKFENEERGLRSLEKNSE